MSPSSMTLMGAPVAPVAAVAPVATLAPVVDFAGLLEPAGGGQHYHRDGRQARQRCSKRTRARARPRTPYSLVCSR